MIINPRTLAFVVLQAEGVPGCGLDVFAAIFGPFNVGHPTQNTGAFFADVAGVEERADVEAHAVVEVGVQPMGCSAKDFQRTNIS